MCKTLAKFFWIVYDKKRKINRLMAHMMQECQLPENLRGIQ